MNSLLLILFLRLERNQEREKESANLEYMKNVILQFLKCRPNEREHLVPVLTTMLKLSQDEKELIVQLARGMMWIHEVTLKMNLYQSFCISKSGSSASHIRFTMHTFYDLFHSWPCLHTTRVETRKQSSFFVWTRKNNWCCFQSSFFFWERQVTLCTEQSEAEMRGRLPFHSLDLGGNSPLCLLCYSSAVSLENLAVDLLIIF